MSFCGSAISDPSLRSIGLHLLHLKHLSVRGCVRVTGNGVEAVADGCTQLESFDVSQCKNLAPWIEKGGPLKYKNRICFDTVARNSTFKWSSLSCLHFCTVRINGSQAFIYIGIFLLVFLKPSLANELWSSSLSWFICLSISDTREATPSLFFSCLWEHRHSFVFLFFSWVHDWWLLRGLLSPVDVWILVRVVFLSIYLPLYCWAFYPFSLELGLCISRTRSSKTRAWAWEEFGWRQNIMATQFVLSIWFDFSSLFWCKPLYPTQRASWKVDPNSSQQKNNGDHIFVLIHLCSFFVTLLCSSIFYCYYFFGQLSFMFFVAITKTTKRR